MFWKNFQHVFTITYTCSTHYVLYTHGIDVCIVQFYIDIFIQNYNWCLSSTVFHQQPKRRKYEKNSSIFLFVAHLFFFQPLTSIHICAHRSVWSIYVAFVETISTKNIHYNNITIYGYYMWRERGTKKEKQFP